MKFYLINLTNESLFVGPIGSTILPNAVAALPTNEDNVILSSSGESSDITLEKPVFKLKTNSRYTVNLKKSSFRWNHVSMSEGCPWRVYRDQVSRKRIDILVLPKRPTESFLADIPDVTSLYSLCLPGTHDTMAFYGWPVSQCQSATTPLSVQLVDGIRVCDIRLAIKNGQLVAYHGQYPQRTTFRSIIDDLHAFLTSPVSARETIVVSIKQEDYDSQTPDAFSSLVREEIEAGPGGIGMWFLENRIPTLGEVRGKAIMFSRFGGDGTAWEGGLEGMGIHPTNWPDSAKQVFTWPCKDVLVRTQDWYNIPSFLSIPEKTQLSIELLLPPPADVTQPVLSITYLSASSFPFATPSVVSMGFGWPNIGFGVEGVNSRVTRFLIAVLRENTMLRSWTLMDFYDKPAGSSIVPLLIECNFRGRPRDAHRAIVTDSIGRLDHSRHGDGK